MCSTMNEGWGCNVCWVVTTLWTGPRDQVQEAESEGPGDHSVVCDLEVFSDGNPFSGLQQHSGKSSLSSLSWESSPSGALYIMVTESQGHKSSLWYLGGKLHWIGCSTLSLAARLKHFILTSLTLLACRAPPPLPMQTDWPKNVLYMYPALSLVSFALHELYRRRLRSLRFYHGCEEAGPCGPAVVWSLVWMGQSTPTSWNSA